MSARLDSGSSRAAARTSSFCIIPAIVSRVG
jgi:hypothetical protein